MTSPTIATVTPFGAVQSALTKHFKRMSEHPLFRTDAEGDVLWETYLKSFPPGTNPLYKVRAEYDCSCCRQFVRHLGGVVAIVGGEVVTLWDFKVEGSFQAVIDAMREYVEGRTIQSVYLHSERLVGTANSRQLLDDKSVKTWDHFHVNLPVEVVVAKGAIGTAVGEWATTQGVMQRALTEITPDAVDTVVDLIAQGSLYRGEEHKFLVTEFRALQKRYRTAARPELFVWENLRVVSASVAHIRNSVIGTLLVDLSEGKELEEAVRAFEVKVAPTNYKRPTALVTKAMVAKAQEKVNELGLATALERRYATLDDLTVNNILFADRATRRTGNVFDEIAASAAVDVKKLGKIEEIGVEDFVEKVLPTATEVQVLLENRHAGNMVSLIAPVDATAQPLFKWANGMSWSYVGDLADSIKERVKKAGGSVTGDYRASLAWWNFDDLDLHLKLPDRDEISFMHKTHYATRGSLDVDMNAGHGTTRNAVENITFPERKQMLEGEYTLFVNQYCQRETADVGFEVEMEFEGAVWGFAWPKAVRTSQNVVVCKFEYNHKTGLKIVESLPSTSTSKTVWGLATQTFHKVRCVMLSPNRWDGGVVGNKHYFFMLDRCVNDGTARGFFNEFLKEELTPHRKVLEMVGAKMKTERAEEQLSGLGFSSTRREWVLCKVKGSFTRTVKVVF